MGDNIFRHLYLKLKIMAREKNACRERAQWGKGHLLADLALDALRLIRHHRNREVREND